MMDYRLNAGLRACIGHMACSFLGPVPEPVGRQCFLRFLHEAALFEGGLVSDSLVRAFCTQTHLSDDCPDQPPNRAAGTRGVSTDQSPNTSADRCPNRCVLRTANGSRNTRSHSRTTDPDYKKTRSMTALDAGCEISCVAGREVGGTVSPVNDRG